MFAADGWLIDPETARPSTLIFATIAAVALFGGVLFKLGVIPWVLGVAGAVVRGGIRTGFRLWERTLSWAPWPVYAVLVVALLGAGVWVADRVPVAAVPFALALLFFGLVACLAYMFLDVERYEVARGYKALHTPLNGQRLATELVKHGRRVGVPLLAAAGVGMIGGFALLNHALTGVVGNAWFSTPTGPPTYLDHVASVLVYMLSVVDLLNVVETQRFAHVVLPGPVSGVAKAAVGGFKSFFTLVLLQQIFASVRRGKVLAETIADFWSPHPPIRERARAALPQYGATALSPLLLSLRGVDTLTHEQREQLPEILATVGPAGIPDLVSRLNDPNEHVRAVVATTLGRLRAGAVVLRLAELASDSSTIVRESVADALGDMGRGGWPPPAARLGFAWLHGLRFWRSKRADDPKEAVLAALRTALADSSAAVRSAAASSVARLGAKVVPELLPQMAERLADPDETVRVRAIEAVGVVGADHADTVPTLAGLLTDPSVAVRTAAAVALGGMREKAEAAVLALVPLLDDRDEGVRAAAADAVGKIGTLPQSATNSFAEGLACDDTVRRARTAEALGSIGEAAADAAPALAEAAADDNDRVRAKAVQALGKIGEAAAGVAVPRLVRALKDPDDWVSALAAEALGEMGEAAVDAALPALMKSLAHANAQVRQNAAEAVGKLGPAARSAVPALEHAAADPDNAVRVRAVSALGLVGRPRPATVQVVKGALADPDPQLREAAVAAFGEWGAADAEVRAALLTLLGDPNDAVKLRAVRVLPSLAGEGDDVVEALTRRLTDDDSGAVKAEAARALGQLGPSASAAGAALLRAIQTGELEVREEAMRAVVLVQPPEAAAAFTAGLHDADASVRKLASAGWRKAADIPESAVAGLVEALQDPEVQVRANAAHAVGRMDPVPAEAVPLLAECLATDAAGLRLSAALALQAAPGEPAANALRPLLDDANPKLRLIAARRVLADDPTDERAAVAVAAAVADPNPSVRRAADDLLAALDQAAVPTVQAAVQSRLTGEENADVIDQLNRTAERLEPVVELAVKPAAG